MALSKNQKKDFKKFFIEKGDADFNPEHNKYVIEKTIRDNEKLIKQKKKTYAEQVRERADAVASYLKSKAADSGKPIEQYIGKRGLAYLQGRKIIQKLQTLKNGTKVITIN